MNPPRIESINQLQKLEDGRYYLNFGQGRYDGHLTVNSEDVAKRWIIDIGVEIAENFSLGTTDYNGDDKFLSNIKVFRLWSPSLDGGTENFVVGIMGWENGMYWEFEKLGLFGRFMPGLRSKLTPGREHRFRLEYQESSQPGIADGSFKIFFNGQVVEEKQNIVTNKTGKLKRPLIIGFQEMWNEGPKKEPNEYWLRLYELQADDGVVVDEPTPSEPPTEPAPADPAQPKEFSAKWNIFKDNPNLAWIKLAHGEYLIGDPNGHPNALTIYLPQNGRAEFDPE